MRISRLLLEIILENYLKVWNIKIQMPIFKYLIEKYNLSDDFLYSNMEYIGGELNKYVSLNYGDVKDIDDSEIPDIVDSLKTYVDNYLVHKLIGTSKKAM